MKQVDAALVLDPGRLAGVDEAAGYGDELAGKCKSGFPVDAIHRQRAVAPHAAAHVQDERLAQLLLVETVYGSEDRDRAAHRVLGTLR
jgi:hypothetical protein